MAAVTTIELVDLCRHDHLLAGRRIQRARIGSSVSPVLTTIVSKYDSHGISAGAVLSAGFEDMSVWEITSGDPNVFEVERGDFGTEAEAHDFDDVMEINATFSRGKTLAHMRSALRDLDAEVGLWKPIIEEFTYTSGTSLITLANEGKVREVQVEGQSTEDEWLPLQDFRVTSAVGATPTLFVGASNSIDAGRKIRVVIEGPLGELTTGSTDVAADVGLGSPNILSFGAAISATLGRALRRTDMSVQGDSRRSNEVAGFSTSPAVSGLVRAYNMALKKETQRLLAAYPVRVRRGSF